MNAMMLWFDNTNSPLMEKVKRAAQYYEKKYGRKAALCYIHSSQFEPGTGVPGIRIEVSGKLLPNDFWLGEAEPFFERPTNVEGV